MKAIVIVKPGIGLNWLLSSWNIEKDSMVFLPPAEFMLPSIWQCDLREFQQQASKKREDSQFHQIQLVPAFMQILSASQKW